MTRDEILSMQPGPELDVELSAKLLGFRWYSRPYVLGEAHERYLVFTNDPTRVDVPEDDPRVADIKHWEGKSGKLALSEVSPLSTTWEGMRLVTEAMAANDWLLVLERFGKEAGGGWYAAFNYPFDRTSAHAETAPHAVAIAALLAMEAERT